MTLGKASLMVAGFAGSMALGVWMAPYVTDRSADVRSESAAVAQPQPAPVVSPVERREAAYQKATMTRINAVAPTAPALHDRLEGVLAQGTDPGKAAAGFNSAEQFATVAYLSRNTAVPFVLLKHRVLNEGKSLSAALKMSKPDVDAESEINRARAEARADLWSIG